jgi:glutaminyl-tRNA synthetase
MGLDAGAESTAGDAARAADAPRDFIREIVESDIAASKNGSRVVTRFPPEPNGYLHIGHAKSICLNFGIALEYGGVCHLRMDDTNPCKEDVEYIESIQEDVRWLGFVWGDHLYYASDYYERLYQCGEQLITDGKAFVCELDEEAMRTYRGTLTEPGRPSPWRDRPVDESLDLFRRMRAGEFPDGKYVLRAKIDMSSPNINMRDPVMYRIRHAHHPRTGDQWCIYPMYDFAHCVSDAIEKITHSICTLEFEDHRPLYDWFLDELHTPVHPQQIEFARLNLTYTVMSKRKLLELVQTKTVSGWDDPRMPTICGLRRRGYTAGAIRKFCETIGVAKRHSVVEIALLEHCLRDDLNPRARRVMAVLNPIKVVIDNYPEGQVEELEADNNSEDPAAGKRTVPFSRELWIEADDFREDPPKKFFRLSPGSEVRLKHAYFIRCERVVKDADGKIVELRCTYDPATRGGESPDGRKVKGTLHWVSVAQAVPAEVRLYDHLFTVPNPDDLPEGQTYRDVLNLDSLVTLKGAMVEPSLGDAKPGEHFQFLRTGYFAADSDSAPGRPVFNRTVSLKDSWGKIEKKS